MARRDVRLGGLLRADLDGIPLDLAAALLPWRTRLNLGLAATSTCTPARSGGTPADDVTAAVDATAPRSSPTRLAALARQPARDGRGPRLGAARAPSGPTTRDNTSYDDASDGREGRGSSTSACRTPGAARGLGPRRQHRPLQPDRGRRAASGSSPSTSIRRPPSATTGALRQRAARTDILPLVLDLANPSPAIGWGNASGGRCSSARTPTSCSRWRWSTTSRSRATCRCRCCSTCSRRWRRTPSSSSCPRRTRWSGACSRPARRLPGLHARRVPGRAAGTRFEIVGETPDRGEPAGPVPAPPLLS